MSSVDSVRLTIWVVNEQKFLHATYAAELKSISL
jgi:hypothetical protein